MRHEGLFDFCTLLLEEVRVDGYASLQLDFYVTRLVDRGMASTRSVFEHAHDAESNHRFRGENKLNHTDQTVTACLECLDVLVLRRLSPACSRHEK
jgi:hypothetical protein